jgi:hypothetical protein
MITLAIGTWRRLSSERTVPVPPRQPDLQGCVPEGAPAHDALLRCYKILARVGQEADLAGLPDPPPEAQVFGALHGPATGGDAALKPEG